MPGLTPYKGFHYPLIGETVNASSLQTLASDFDAAVTTDDVARQNAFRRPGAQVRRNTGQSITKATITAITMDTVGFDNGAAQFGAAFWAAGNPTRLTVTQPGLYFAHATALMNFGTNLGASGGCCQVMIAKNGGTAQPNVQMEKYQMSTNSITGTDPNMAVCGMWNMAATDYLELKLYWAGSPAGPFSTVGTYCQLGISLISLP